MDGCSCSIVGSEELKALLGSDQSDERERALAHIETLLTSRDQKTRARAYLLLEEGLNDALFCSCLNYRSLVGGFTHPLLTAVKRAFEAWAQACEGSEPGAIASSGPQEPSGSAMANRHPIRRA